MLGYSHEIKNTNPPDWFQKRGRANERLTEVSRHVPMSNVTAAETQIKPSHSDNEKEIILLNNISRLLQKDIILKKIK